MPEDEAIASGKAEVIRKPNSSWPVVRVASVAIAVMVSDGLPVDASVAPFTVMVYPLVLLVLAVIVWAEVAVPAPKESAVAHLEPLTLKLPKPIITSAGMLKVSVAPPPPARVTCAITPAEFKAVPAFVTLKQYTPPSVAFAFA